MDVANLKKTNPLGLEPKREKSGSNTFRKYNYQYHWAFCRILDEHEAGNEFALFIEEHEDVTIASSLDVAKTTFELNQVKETSKQHTIHSLTSVSKGESQSLIEKLAMSCCDKSYSHMVSKVNFVSTGGYSFDIHKKGYSFEVIDSGVLSDEEVKRVEDSVSRIPGVGNFISKLAFVIPSLPNKGFDLVVEGKISSLISKIAPGLKYDANSIYECVIRDLNRKGENSFDYKNWDDAIKRKAITSGQLSDVIEQYIGRKPDENIVSEMRQILNEEYSLNALTRRKVVSGFNRYYTKRISSRELIVKEVSSDLVRCIKSLVNNYSNVRDLEAAVKSDLCENTLSYFQTQEDITGAFLYELLEGVEI